MLTRKLLAYHQFTAGGRRLQTKFAVTVSENLPFGVHY